MLVSDVTNTGLNILLMSVSASLCRNDYRDIMHELMHHNVLNICITSHTIQSCSSTLFNDVHHFRIIHNHKKKHSIHSSPRVRISPGRIKFHVQKVQRAEKWKGFSQTLQTPPVTFTAAPQLTNSE